MPDLTAMRFKQYHWQQFEVCDSSRPLYKRSVNKYPLIPDNGTKSSKPNQHHGAPERDEE